jgi:hypothetical protein
LPLPKVQGLKMLKIAFHNNKTKRYFKEIFWHIFVWALMPRIFSVNHVFGTFYLIPQGRRNFLMLFTKKTSS